MGGTAEPTRTILPASAVVGLAAAQALVDRTMAELQAQSDLGPTNTAMQVKVAVAGQLVARATV